MSSSAMGARIGPRLDLRQSQSLVMTPQLRQAIKLLQFSNLEVAAFVEEELQRNPLLERDDSADALVERPACDQLPDRSDPHRDAAELLAGTAMTDTLSCPLDVGEAFDPGGEVPGLADRPADDIAARAGPVAAPALDGRGVEELAEHRPCLREHLAEQLRLNMGDRIDRLIGVHLIAMLDANGRLAETPDALALALGTTIGRIEAVRHRMQRFDPVGLFCVDLRECLSVQLAERNRLDPAMAALLDHLDLLARRELPRLMAICGVDGEDLADMIAELRALDPRPGDRHDAAPPITVVPDVLMRRVPAWDATTGAGAPAARGPGAWLLELNPHTMPRVLVNQSFHLRVARTLAGKPGGADPRVREDRAFLSEQLQTANWLVKSLQQRAQTILRVAGEIVRRQDGFFTHGVGHLRPLILREVADAVGLHESTVSRVTANKYIATPRGTFELKFFFTAAIAGTDGQSHSAEAVRHRIRALVGAEDAARVLSDDAIVAVLKREGVDIARRTVAKYRDALHIPSSMQRRRDKVVPA